jgi:nucleoside-diphosphate-sugar epimerase
MKRCLMTGTTGYVGSRIEQRFKAEGWQVVRLSRSATASPDVIPFRLGDEIMPDQLAGFSTLVHCAYDFGPVSRKEIQAVNVVGSERLLRCAQRAGVERVIFISSISAFHGCRSLYGQAKLQVEDVVRSMGGWIIRPGLVWGDRPGGLFGRLLQTVRRAPILPLPAGGPQIQYLVHDADLSEAVWGCVGRESRSAGTAVTVAHPDPWLLRDLVREMARGLKRRPVVVPIPWELVWLGLRVNDWLHLPLRFHGDNLVSFVHQNPSPTFNAFEALGVRCREFRLDRTPPH